MSNGKLGTLTEGSETDQEGTFTFTNGSSTSTMTSVACYRNPEFNHWWYNEGTSVPWDTERCLPIVNDWWLFLLVPMFAASLGIWFRADYRSRDMIVMVIVGSAGYAVSFFLDTVRLTSHLFG
jgi:hypothetical protein